MKFHVFGTAKHGEEKSLLNNLFFPHLSVHCGDVIEQIKKICPIHFNNNPDKKLSAKFHGQRTNASLQLKICIIIRLVKP